MYFAFPAQIKMLQKIIDCESLETSQENAYDGVYFTNVKSLPRADCSFTIKRIYHRFFLEYVPRA